MPRSSALCMTLRDASRSIRSPPKLLHPSPTTETLRPDLPRLRCCIVLALTHRGIERAPVEQQVLSDDEAGRRGAEESARLAELERIAGASGRIALEMLRDVFVD